LYRRHLRWLSLAAALVFLAVFFQYHDEELYRQSLGRLSFMALCLLLLLAFQRWMRPRGPLFAGILRRNPSSTLYRVRYPLTLLVVSLPLLLLGLAATGYYFTAYRLSSRLLATFYVMVTIVLIHDVFLRAILIRHRRLAYQRRQQLIAEAAAAAKASDHPATEIVVEPEPEIELSEISDQTRQLIRVVLVLAALLASWLIWIDFLPALRLLDDRVLWTVSVGEVVEPVTVAHLLICILILFVTAVAVKNLPGLLELVFLQRLPLDAGARYAIATISRYAMAIVGGVIALNMIRIQWSQYSWIVAAATVGLGFGLQEIFANFVSGLIVLLERPVRVGDVVTVGRYDRRRQPDSHAGHGGD
jgi:potassium efflux system protein